MECSYSGLQAVNTGTARTECAADECGPFSDLVAIPQAAILVFLTLNTTRARLDLIQRLAKLRTTSPADREAVLGFADRLGKESGLRNKFNHCIYSFDEKGEASTQLMRVADVGEDLRYGKVELLDRNELDRLNAAIDRIVSVNRDIWDYIRNHRIAP